jgi:aryl-alcohol dehydrogenase-like predicted oxidoreductase
MEYMQKMFISTEIIKPNDISSGYNVLNPDYIARCIDKSLTNMHLNCIDLVYIHNAFESWYEDVSREEFMQMLSKVFEVYEEYRSRKKIQYYGMATWTCFRVNPDSREYLSLEETVKVAEKIGGKDHGFRFIQLPYNLAYNEAIFLKNQDVESLKNLTILEAAERLNIGVFTSIPLFQGRLLNAKIPDYGGLTDQVEKLIQIIRSTPFVISPLIGQKKHQHVQQNIKIANIPPLSNLEYKKAIEMIFKPNL